MLMSKDNFSTIKIVDFGLSSSLDANNNNYY